MTPLTWITASLVLFAGSAAPAAEAGSGRLEAAAIVRGGLAAGAADGLPSGQRVALLERAAATAAQALGSARAADVLRTQVGEARRLAQADEAAAARWLRRELERTATDLAFTPVREAELPVGFPEPTPVLEIELKHYPAYRMASAPSGGRGGGFWTLFRHIESREIAMTAPVEMTYAEREDLREERMAFLYGSMDIGEIGQAGSVNVVDVEPTWVVSLGCRGRMTRERVAAARAELERWVNAAGAWEAVGPLRSMGYNSPMVPASKSYFEVQLPVRRVETYVAAGAGR